MPIEIPIGWIVALNIIGWPIIQLTVAKLFLMLPATSFTINGWLFKTRRWERNGRTYEQLTGVRLWKRLLPDGAPCLRGFSKKTLQSADRTYFQAFIRETCRGELAHWVMLLVTPIFFLWNPIWADGVMCLYAVCVNLPCIVAQRYNRIRLRRACRSVS